MTDEQAKLKYPTLERMKEVNPFSQEIGSFLEWLSNEKGISMAKDFVEEKIDSYGKPYKTSQIMYITVNYEKMLAEYFGIDLAKAEQERVAILEEVRKANNT